jgi:hypothetical protein
VSASGVNPPLKETENDFWGGLLDGLQTALDVVGLVPGLGEIADDTNALIRSGVWENPDAGVEGVGFYIALPCSVLSRKGKCDCLERA